MRPRAASVCPQPGCNEDQPCPEHTPKPWASSDRRQRLPRNWARTRQRIINRDRGRCQQPGCDSPGTEVDHIVNGDDHSLANLQLLCAPHHREKTQAEANAWRKP